MSIDFTNPPEEEQTIPPLNKFVPRVITGGKGPPGSPDWLSNLEVGDVFLARHSQKAEVNFELNTFCVMLKTGKSVKLVVYLSDKERMIRWVEPKVFSREMIFQEVIGNNAEVTITTEPED